MNEDDIRKALKRLDNHENELRELKKDIHALAHLEIAHASGYVRIGEASEAPTAHDIDL